MKIKVVRAYKKDTYTIGKMYVNGVYFCDTLEDKDRGLSQGMTLQQITNIKVKGKTAIPAGTYTVLETYSNRFKKVMPEVICVKGFAGIRIHSGNTADDTEGCLLVGENKAKGKVLNSKFWYTNLNDRINYAVSHHEAVQIEII